MLSYRHQFHAGNIADVFKHALLTRLLLALNRKDKPYCVVETHAGVGLYDLQHPWAQKTEEWRKGISKVFGRADAPESLRPYLDAVHAENSDGHLRNYPGSPRIARRLMRDADRLVLYELNSEDCETLLGHFRNARHTSIHQQDGYTAIKATLPPKERRGLLFIDASFDQGEDFARVARAVKEAHARFATGMIAVWYPLMGTSSIEAFERSLASGGLSKTLQLELYTEPRDYSDHIPGSGLIVVNPPYGLDQEAPPLLDWLWRVLSPDGKGGTRCEWLIPE